MAAGDLYQLVVAFANQNTGKGLSFTLAGEQPGILAPSMTALGDDIKTWWNAGGGGGAAVKSYCAAAIELTEVTLRRVKPLEPLIQSYTDGLPIAGTDATDPYSGQVGPLVTLRTANIGKSYRGRVYLPPVAEDKVSANASLSAADAEDLAESFSDMLAALAADQFTPVVWSRVLDLGTVITDIFVDRILRTQRRRQDRAPVYVAP